MKNIPHILHYRPLLLLPGALMIVLAACNDSIRQPAANPATPTDPHLEFQIMPDTIFANGYTKTYQIKGVATTGDPMTETIAVATQFPTTFNGESAIAVLSQVQITNTKTHASGSGSTMEYYSVGSAGVKLLGYKHVIEKQANGPSYSLTRTGTTIGAIPRTAKIGDSGVIGTYTGGSDDTVDTETWRLTDARNGLANFEIDVFSVKHGVLDSVAEESYVIDQSGNRQALTNKLFYTSSWVTLTLK